MDAGKTGTVTEFPERRTAKTSYGVVTIGADTTRAFTNQSERWKSLPQRLLTVGNASGKWTQPDILKSPFSREEETKNEGP